MFHKLPMIFIVLSCSSVLFAMEDKIIANNNIKQLVKLENDLCFLEQLFLRDRFRSCPDDSNIEKINCEERIAYDKRAIKKIESEILQLESFFSQDQFKEDYQKARIQILDVLESHKKNAQSFLANITIPTTKKYGYNHQENQTGIKYPEYKKRNLVRELEELIVKLEERRISILLKIKMYDALNEPKEVKISEPHLPKFIPIKIQRSRQQKSESDSQASRKEKNKTKFYTQTKINNFNLKRAREESYDQKSFDKSKKVCK